MRPQVKAVIQGCLFLMLVFVGLPVMYYLIVFGDRANACWEDSEAVAKARALSTDRLRVLYRDMKKYATANDTPIEGYSRFKAGNPPMPPEFADLGAVRVRPKFASIMLEGCLDAFVHLEFEGLTDSATPARIVLTWGDHHEPGQQILWQE
jgi:hypothetical protein